MSTAAYICLAFMVVFGVMAVMSRRMINSAICLAVVSAAVGVLMYLMGAVWASVFEISVCSGLVTVVMVSAISLTKSNDEHVPEIDEDHRRTKILPVILIVCGIGLVLLAMNTGFNVPDAAAANDGATFGQTLWDSRQADLWGQMIVLLTGTAAIVVFFKERD